jgi:hypothetical protein
MIYILGGINVYGWIVSPNALKFMSSTFVCVRLYWIEPNDTDIMLHNITEK